MNSVLFWSEFGILFAVSLLGSLAVLPYSLRLLKESSQSKPLKMSLPKLALLSFLQAAVIFAIVVGVGLLASHAIGLGAPYLESAIAGNGISSGILTMLPMAVALGIFAGLALFLLDLFFLPRLPKTLLDSALKTTAGENFLAAFYGGINEELLMRLFGLSSLAWLLSRIWHTLLGLPTSSVLWIANVTLAIIFGLGHLPTLKNLTGKITPLLLVRTLILNGLVGLICGWLFWTYGIEAAIVAHFITDVVYHVGGTMVLQRRMENG